MPIEFRTGLPGAGKTLGAVERLMELQEKSPERPRYVLGITDLRDDLATVITEDQLKDWAAFPAGSIIMVDECQKYMPARRQGDPPKWIKDLSTHRHLGLDFVLISQHPSLIDTYVRRLVDRHIHTVRKYGTSYVERWEFPECVSEPTNKSTQKGASSKSLSKFNSKAMQAYTSAELHTVERRIPRFIYVGAALLVLIPTLAFLSIHIMRRIGSSDDAPKAASSESVSPLSSQVVSGPRSSSKDHVMTRDEWIAKFEPRVQGMPWSAPAYDRLEAQGVPEVYCMISHVGEPDEHCRCITEQGTRAVVPAGMCRRMAEDGTYNPYRRAPPSSERREGREDGSGDPEPVEVASAAQPRIGRVASSAVLSDAQQGATVPATSVDRNASIVPTTHSQYPLP